MKHSRVSRVAGSILLLAALSSACLTTGCAGPAGLSGDSSVVEAYNSPNIVQIKPYTRTIFSTTDF